MVRLSHVAASCLPKTLLTILSAFVCAANIVNAQAIHGVPIAAKLDLASVVAEHPNLTKFSQLVKVRSRPGVKCLDLLVRPRAD